MIFRLGCGPTAWPRTGEAKPDLEGQGTGRWDERKAPDWKRLEEEPIDISFRSELHGNDIT